ncbi:hypothetical protein ACWGJ2_37385 [Streptomyces sp. NPDC054796]
MSSGHKTMTLFLTVISGLILAILGLCLHWPLWAWATAAAFLLAAAVLAGRTPTPRAGSMPREFTLEPDLPIAPQERREQIVTDVALPSSAEDYDVLFSAVVRWWPLEAAEDAPAISPGGLAVSAILERAGRMTALYAPHRTSLVQHQLNGLLGTMEADPTGRVLAMAENVTLTLPESDSARLSRLSTVRKDEDLWEHERKYECNRREYLSKDVLKDTGSAVVWWLSKNDDHIKKTVDDIGVLAQLSSAANNDGVPEEFQHMVPYPYPPPEPVAARPGGQEGVFTTTAPYGNGNGSYSAEASTGARGSAADHFGKMLEELGLDSQDPQSSLLAQAVSRITVPGARQEAVDDILRKFDASSAEAQDFEEGTKTTTCGSELDSPQDVPEV